MSKIKKCSVQGCNGLLTKDSQGMRRYLLRGLCIKHYHRLRDNGDVTKVQYRHNSYNTRHPLYRTYCNILGRCYNSKNRDWLRFGGAGIGICDRWLGVDGFANFAKDMSNKPTGFVLARKNKVRDFSPTNCAWVKNTGRGLQ